MDIRKVKEKISEQILEELKILDGTIEQEQQRQNYLQKICQRLIGDDLDFEKYPVYFCIVDDENPNAAFIPPKRPQILSPKDEWGNERSEKEIAEAAREQYPIVFVTKGLLEMAENEAQLAYILGHELGHLRQDFLLGEHYNSKMEEITSDFSSLDMMAKAGYNINEARNIASHIFSNEQMYYSLKQMLARALDEHPNNESRLNAIDIKIKTIEDSYQKQNININNFEAAEIPSPIVEDYQSNRYISFFEKELKELGYYDSSLEQKQEILIQYMKDMLNRDEFWQSDSIWKKYLLPCYDEALGKIIYAHIGELRKEMPRRIIKQSDAEHFTKWLGYEDRKKDKEKWLELVGKEYCLTYLNEFDIPEYQADREVILKSFPFKIVPDEEYEQQVAIEKAKKAEQRRKLANGTDLTLQFWDRILSENIPVYNRYAAFALDSLEGIDLTKTTVGKLATEAINKLINGETYVPSTYIKLLDCYQGYDLEKNLVKDMQMHYVGAMGQFFYKFDPQSFPSLNLEMTENPTIKKIPPRILFDNIIDSSKFGITTQHIVDDVYYVIYDANYQDPYKNTAKSKYWGYFVDKDGNILDSFSPEKYAEKEALLIEQKRKDFFKQLANIIKEDYAMLQKLKQDPNNANIPTHALYRLKHYTGSYLHTFKSEDENFSRLDIYNATVHNNDPRLKYHTLKLKDTLLHDYYELKEKSTLSSKYLDFDEDLILSFLTEEEKKFASTPYISENDEAVFNAMCQETIKTGNYMLQMREVGSSDFSEYYPNWYILDQNMGNFTTNEQLIKYHKKYLEITDSDTIKNGYSNDVYNMTNLELKNLMAYIEQQVNTNPDINYKDIDFKNYQSLFGDTFFEKIGIPADLSEFKKDKDLTSRQSFFLNYALTTYILKGESNKLPLTEFFGSTSSTLYFTNIVKEKFEPFLLNRENYPQDTIEAVKTYNAIPSSARNLEKIGPFIIDIIRSETDAKKALKASTQFLEALKYENTNITANLKNQLLENSIIFDKNLPLIQRIGAYQQIAEVSGFADDYKIQNKLLKDFMVEIEAIKDPYERNAHYDIFINKQHRISDPDIRREYQRLWVESVFAACGHQIDDNSKELHAKIKPFINKLHGTYKTKFWGGEKNEDNVNMADRLEIAKLLADKFVSQEELSMLIRPQPAGFDEMQQGNRDSNSMMIIGFDTMKMLIEHKPSEATELIDFLLSKGNPEQCQNYAKHITQTLNDVYQHHSYVKKEISPETLQVLHREFWGYPLEARAVLINELLHSSSSSNNEERWEDIFKKVAPRIFPNADSNMSKIGTEFLHSYIKSRKDNERTLYLAAMMVAANENSETTDPEKSIAKGIRLFLENSGPAAIKLGQAMASYTDVPKFIRDEMQELKSNASRPSRWEIYEWLDFYKKQDGDEKLNFGKDVWLGKILGSASYFVTLEKGNFENGKVPFQTDKVTKILRAGAKISSDKEFKIFEKMLLDLSDKGIMKNGIDTFMRLIEQAKDTVKVETDLNIGYEQLQTAKELYKEKEISIDGYKFKVHVADWPEYGKNWADLERAQGSDLDKIQDPNYKKAVSKAYFSLELMNMLAGGKFDHDRHGKQLKIDTKNNIIGVFDTGAMAIVDPSPKDKEILGKIIYKTLEKVLTDNEGGFSKVGAILSEEIDKVYTSKETTSPYLTECQRGLLALTDFYKDFDGKDFIECFNAALNNKEMPLDKHIMNGFINEAIKSVGIFESEQSLLSYEDKEKLGSLLFNISATQFMKKDKNIPEIIEEEITKMQEGLSTPMPLLGVISSKLKDVKDGPLGLDIPKEFIPTLSDFINRQNVDVAILKGMAREMLTCIDLQKEQEQFSPHDRQEFGRLIYDTFEASRKHKDKDIATTFLELQKNGNYDSEYAAKIAMIITVASKIKVKENAQGFNAEELVKSVLLSGKMDKEIVKGITDSIKAKNPDSVSRGIIAKSVSSFLTQKTTEPNIFKKALIRMFVKKKNPIQTAQQTINEAIENSDTRKKLVNYIKGYIDKIERLSSIRRIQDKTGPKIKISTPTYNM